MTTTINHRLCHDVAWAATERLVREAIKPEGSTEAYEALFMAVYEHVRLALVDYAERWGREQQRLGRRGDS